MLFDFCPTGAGWLLFFPNDHLAVIRARGEDMAELRVSPGNLPYGAGMSARWTEEFRTFTVFGAGKENRFTLSVSGRRHAGAHHQLRRRL